MSHTTVTFPSYTIGKNVLKTLEEVCLPYGKKILVVGGYTAIEKVKEELIKATNNTNLEIIDFVWYGGDCTYENIDKIVKQGREDKAEIIIGVGGGKAIDTAKGIAYKLSIPIITVPTIAATCAAMTSLSVVYTNKGDLDSFFFYEKPPVHCIMDSHIIAKAPSKYLRAGIGDTIAKHYECTLASRGQTLNHSSAMAREISRMCVEPLLQYGEQALLDANNGTSTFEVEQVVLNNIVSTGMVSMLIEEKYNGAVAHSLFYGLTLLPHIEKEYLHGDVVAYGVLVQLAIDNNIEEVNKLYKFFKKIGIPTSIKDIDVKNDRTYLDSVLQETIDGPDMECLPYKITKDMVFDGIQTVENI